MADSTWICCGTNAKSFHLELDWDHPRNLKAPWKQSEGASGPLHGALRGLSRAIGDPVGLFGPTKVGLGPPVGPQAYLGALQAFSRESLGSPSASLGLPLGGLGRSPGDPQAPLGSPQELLGRPCGASGGFRQRQGRFEKSLKQRSLFFAFSAKSHVII